MRTAAFFSPHDPHNFAAWVVRELSAGRTVTAARDCVVSPTYVPDLVSASLDLLIDGETGVRHLTNGGAVSWAEFAVRVADAVGLDPALVRGVPAAEMGWPAERPAYAALGTERGQLLPSFEAALEKFASHVRHEREQLSAVEAAERRTGGLRGDAASAPPAE